VRPDRFVEAAVADAAHGCPREHRHSCLPESVEDPVRFSASEISRLHSQEWLCHTRSLAVRPLPPVEETNLMRRKRA
jgi:hypothetical protein